jgi:predicted dehydrogenase
MKLAFVGFGRQAKENLLPACRAFFDVEIASICDIDEAKLQEAREAFPGAEVFADYREMMDRTSPDAVIAACYPADHYGIAMNALKRGIAVFIEKPLAPSSWHVSRLVEAAKLRRCATGVGMNFRFAEVTQRLRSIAEGEINSITLRQHANKPTTPYWDYSSVLRSFLHAQTIHGLDFLIHLCGPVRELWVTDSSRGNKIMFTVGLGFESGAHGSLITSNTSPHFVFDFDAICRESVHVNSSSLWSMSVSELGRSYHNGETKKWHAEWSPSPLASGFERSGYHGQFLDFISAIKLGRESGTSFASLRETYRCMDMIEEICLRKQPVIEALEPC